MVWKTLKYEKNFEVRIHNLLDIEKKIEFPWNNRLAKRVVLNRAQAVDCPNFSHTMYSTYLQISQNTSSFKIDLKKVVESIQSQ